MHPAGIIVTALHTLENFITSYSPFDPSDANDLERTGKTIPAEEHERPRFMFLHSLEVGGGVQRGQGRRRAHVFTIHHVEGDPALDIAAAALSPTEEYQPLPQLALSRKTPSVGDDVYFLGHYHPPDTPVDQKGYPAGLAVAYSKGRVEAIWSDRLLFSGDTAKGMSGGPVVDAQSRLLGVITEIWPPPLAEARLGLRQQLTSAARIHLAAPSLGKVAAHEQLPLSFKLD